MWPGDAPKERLEVKWWVNDDNDETNQTILTYPTARTTKKVIGSDNNP